MLDPVLLKAIILSLVEGVTEFIPVSSTGHLILAGELLDFNGPLASTFEVVIQLGAILAICVLYFRRLVNVVLGLGSDPASQRLAAAIIIAFLPAALLGLLLHDFIKQVLFSPYVVCISLIVGGIAILLIERLKPAEKFERVDEVKPLTALQIGLFQCVSMIPGVSRSGATIMGALLLGVERKAAAEFSFFLAIPTMLGATALDLWKGRALLDQSQFLIIAIGFAGAFISSLVVVRWLIGYVSRHDFQIFGWYRIIFGALFLGYLLLQ
jgi:undecaprenyl-diphosphatase